MQLTKHIPNTITSMNLLSGAMGVICTFQGEMGLAFLLMLAAAVFDFCDGLSARLLKAYSPIGKELDSLADMVSFGVLPAMMLSNTMNLHGAGWGLACIPLLLAVMSGLRLAKFNVDERQSHDFIGLPTPSAAMICASLCYFIWKNPDTLPAQWAGLWWFLPAVAVALGLLLVSEVPMFGMKVEKGKKLLDTKRFIFLTVSAGMVAAVLVLRKDWSLAVFLVFTFYVLENLILLGIPSKKEAR